MRSVIGEGRTDAEALDRALKELGASLDEVRVEVLEEKRGALFGLLGGRKIRVRVTRQEDAARKIEEVLDGILKRLGIGARVNVRADKGDYSVEVVTMESDGLLIGKHGETLHAIEHLLNRILHRDRGEQGRVRVDIGGYRERRDDQLRSKALGMARKVKESGRELSTDPLYSPDRRVIHLALTGDPAVRTYTVGEGLYKSVVVAPAGGRSEGVRAGGGEKRPRPARSGDRRRR
ncbi:MAG: Jag N-terminal domain-containing protein [Candidatus Eisenbacteria bacterium]|nr:Jag N-terminal domain-containing protein [Candidatus Eisenbacteria bacterium]